MEQDRLDILITATGAEDAQANVAAVRKEMDAAKQEAAQPASTEGIDAIGGSAEASAKSLGLLTRVIGYFNPALAGMLGLFGKARLLTLGVDGAIGALTATMSGLLRVLMSPLVIAIVATVVAIKSAWDSVAASTQKALDEATAYKAKMDEIGQQLTERENKFRQAGIAEETALAGDPRVRALMDRQLQAGKGVSGPAFIQSLQKQITEMQHEAVLPRDKATAEVLDQLVAGDAPDAVIAMMRSSADWGWMKSTVAGQDAESGQPARSELEIAKLLRPSFLKRYPALRAALKGTHEGEAIRAEGAAAKAGMMRAEAERIAPGRMAEIEGELSELAKQELTARDYEAPWWSGEMFAPPGSQTRTEAWRRGELERIQSETAKRIKERDAIMEAAQMRQSRGTNVMVGDNSFVLMREDVYGPNTTTQPAIP